MAAKLEIKGVHIIPRRFANAFSIDGDDGLTLIDEGYPKKEAAVFGLGAPGRLPDRLKQLIFTRAQPDHIGSCCYRAGREREKGYVPCAMKHANRIQNSVMA